MNEPVTDLSGYTPGDYHPGAGRIKRILWYLTNICFFLNRISVSYRLKRSLLRLFGATIGKGVVIKPGVNIKYPWNLNIGDHSWIGEKTWIDNLDRVSIGANACISQGAMLVCGNHDYTKKGFDLIVKPVVLEEGTWVGAGSIVAPGTTMGSHAVLTAGSVASGDLEPYTIYRGNPAVIVKQRKITSA